MTPRLLLLVALLLASPGAGQVRPQVGESSHLQTVAYSESQVVLLEVAPGYQLTVELAPDEQIENIALGDSAAWQVTANRRGDRLFVKALQGGVNTNMTVITNARLYAMELASLFGASPDMAYVVRFTYPNPAESEEEEPRPAPIEGRYRIKGDRALRPIAISDDGRHTYIEWPRDAVLPAVYARNGAGGESLVNGMMRGHLFVIDAVVQQLVFRIDDRSAKATRQQPREQR